eukprot:CAMPEP_0184699690 /NCGR_PEP_ID=MMETSP0313-20130426/5865_1 /TAXON_ID=2792 /ORGANISM="Porphyridium aerugineum, Strain SAG 1380-2" /LENGTH=839 /DNA_ID=CAMNT_0027158813 /DNA_START=532 /DNA_END=3051 /DNA_ORIENTATION=+
MDTMHGPHAHVHNSSNTRTTTNTNANTNANMNMNLEEKDRKKNNGGIFAKIKADMDGANLFSKHNHNQDKRDEHGKHDDHSESDTDSNGKNGDSDDEERGIDRDTDRDRGREKERDRDGFARPKLTLRSFIPRLSDHECDSPGKCVYHGLGSDAGKNTCASTCTGIDTNRHGHEQTHAHTTNANADISGTPNTNTNTNTNTGTQDAVTEAEDGVRRKLSTSVRLHSGVIASSTTSRKLGGGNAKDNTIRIGSQRSSSTSRSSAQHKVRSARKPLIQTGTNLMAPPILSMVNVHINISDDAVFDNGLGEKLITDQSKYEHDNDSGVKGGAGGSSSGRNGGSSLEDLLTEAALRLIDPTCAGQNEIAEAINILKESLSGSRAGQAQLKKMPSRKNTMEWEDTDNIDIPINDLLMSEEREPMQEDHETKNSNEEYGEKLMPLDSQEFGSVDLEREQLSASSSSMTSPREASSSSRQGRNLNRKATFAGGANDSPSVVFPGDRDGGPQQSDRSLEAISRRKRTSSNGSERHQSAIALVKHLKNERIDLKRSTSTDHIASAGHHMSERSSNSLIILDFDDTLFPSSIMVQTQLIDEKTERMESAPCKLKADLQVIERAVISFLMELQLVGHVVIVTNSTQSWIRLMFAKFMPTLEKFIHSEKIRFVSARGAFKKSTNPNNPLIWKVKAFEHEIKEFFQHDMVIPQGPPTIGGGGISAASLLGDAPQLEIRPDVMDGDEDIFTPPAPVPTRRSTVHVLSRSKSIVAAALPTPPQSTRTVYVVGDAEDDMMAAKLAASMRDNVCLKSVKFLDHPKFDQLLLELDYITNHFSALEDFPHSVQVTLHM